MGGDSTRGAERDHEARQERAEGTADEVARRELAECFDITVEGSTNEEFIARYNVAPTQTVPIITASKKESWLLELVSVAGA